MKQNTQTKNAEPVECFTGGEWKLLKGNGTHFATINKDVMTRICTIDVGNIGDKYSGFAPIEEAEANAALIAESKNMYYALKKAYEYRKQTHFGADLLLLEIESILNRINNK